MILRVKFKKCGPVRFIGHLDVMRYFQKTIRRADIDVAYSTGFSPHQIMSFAAPLSVGLESNGEYMDVQVNSLPLPEGKSFSTDAITNEMLADTAPEIVVAGCKEIMDRFNRASVPGIEVLSVIVLPENAGNAMASVAAASYTVTFRDGREPECLKAAIFAENPDKMNALIAAFLQSEQILYAKETKKGTREIDLRPGIYDFSWNHEKKSFFMTMDASSAGNIKPSQILDALLITLDEPVRNGNSRLMENALLVTREETFMDIGTEEERKLVPLHYFN